VRSNGEDAFDVVLGVTGTRLNSEDVVDVVLRVARMCFGVVAGGICNCTGFKGCAKYGNGGDNGGGEGEFDVVPGASGGFVGFEELANNGSDGGGEDCGACCGFDA
jgi:hypothetical protein